MPRKTDASNPADWIWICESDHEGVAALAKSELSYELCRGKLAEIIEKVLKAELIRSGWTLVKTHDLEVLARELSSRDAALALDFKPLVAAYAEVYFHSRYPSYDLEDANWPAFREHVARVGELLQKVKARIV